MIEHFFAPETAPFAVAIGIMVFIALLEGVGLLFGFALSGLVDTVLPDFDVPDVDVGIDSDIHGPDIDAGFDAGDGVFTRFLGWLAVGRVPALILLICFLTAFGIAGILIQSIVRSVSGVYLPALIATVPAFALALPATRYFGLGVAKIMPKEETEAVSQSEFVGKVATIINGVAKRDLPAEAKLTDRHGHTHYLQVEPDIDGEVFRTGTEVLVVRQIGGRFRVIENTHVALSASKSSDGE